MTRPLEVSESDETVSDAAAVSLIHVSHSKLWGIVHAQASDSAVATSLSIFGSKPLPVLAPLAHLGMLCLVCCVLAPLASYMLSR